MDKQTAKIIKKEAEEHIKSIKEDNTLIRIYNVLDPVRKGLDPEDPSNVNRIENIVRKIVSKKYRLLCIIDIRDILDWRVERYNEEQEKIIINAFETIKEIDDRTFWEKLIAVFKGS